MSVVPSSMSGVPPSLAPQSSGCGVAGGGVVSYLVLVHSIRVGLEVTGVECVAQGRLGGSCVEREEGSGRYEHMVAALVVAFMVFIVLERLVSVLRMVSGVGGGGNGVMSVRHAVSGPTILAGWVVSESQA